jgi:hypothetical protein
MSPLARFRAAALLLQARSEAVDIAQLRALLRASGSRAIHNAGLISILSLMA